MRKCANGLSSGLSSGPVKWPSRGPVVAQSGTSQLLVQRGLTPPMGGVAGGVANARKEHANDRERQVDTAQAARAEG